MEQFLKQHIKEKNLCVTASDVTRSPHIELTLVKGDARAFIEGLTPKLDAFRTQNPKAVAGIRLDEDFTRVRISGSAKPVAKMISRLIRAAGLKADRR